MRLKKTIEQHGAGIAVIMTLFAAVIGRYGLGLPFYTPEDPRSILTTAITVSSIAIGFIATAKSVMLTMRNSRAGKNLDKYNLFGICMRYFMASIKGLLIFTAISSLGLFLPSKSEPQWLCDVFCLTWLLSAVWAGALTLRTLWIYEAFAKKVSE